MSWECLNYTIKQSDTQGADRLMLICIANEMNASGEGDCSLAYLAKSANCSVPAARRTIRRLQSLDELDVDIRGGRNFGRGPVNRYRMKRYRQLNGYEEPDEAPADPEPEAPPVPMRLVTDDPPAGPKPAEGKTGRKPKSHKYIDPRKIVDGLIPRGKGETPLEVYREIFTVVSKPQIMDMAEKVKDLDTWRAACYECGTWEKPNYRRTLAYYFELLNGGGNGTNRRGGGNPGPGWDRPGRIEPDPEQDPELAWLIEQGVIGR